MGRFIFICIIATFLGIAMGATPTGKVTFADGSERIIQDPDPLLPSVELTDSCVIGTFATYDKPDFDFYAVKMTYWYYPPNDTGLYCWGDMFFTWGSARPIGSRVDTLAPFASLYAGESLRHEEVIIANEEGLANIVIPIESMFTRKTSLELFSEPNFGGETFCIQDCGGLICEYCCEHDFPGGLSWDIKTAKSARLGCSNMKNSVMSRRLDKEGQYSGYHIHKRYNN